MKKPFTFLNYLICAVAMTTTHILTFYNLNAQNGAAINTNGATADMSAILDVSSINSGILIPRMTKFQRNGIALPANGLMIYQIDDTTGFWYFDGSLWKQLGSNVSNGISPGSNAGNTLYWDGSQWVDSPNLYNNGGAIGIGTNLPNNSASLELGGVSRGLLINRMTTAERNLIANPAEGLQIFNTDNKCFEFYAFGKWNDIACALNCGVDDLIDNRDNNVYKTVKIGNQCWMKENLKYLPAVHNNSEFSTRGINSLPAYGIYNYDGNDLNTAKSLQNYITYGVLYNWFATMDGSNSSNTNPSGVKGICPVGWHLPSLDEWTQLSNFLKSNSQYWCSGNSSNFGKSLASTSGWTTHSTICFIGNDQVSNNSSGFTGLPGGYRYESGGFNRINNGGYWWSSTESSSTLANQNFLYYNSTSFVPDPRGKNIGHSVRCIRD